MPDEVMDALAVEPSGTYLDATYGGGGHSARLLDALAADGRLIAMDQDATAIGGSAHHTDSRLRLVHDSFSAMAAYTEPQSLHGVLMDLGISNLQLADDERGFSFHADGALDMRMNRDSAKTLTAVDWLEQADDEQMADAFVRYGGERHAASIAKEIVRQRAVSGVPDTASALSALICRIKPARDGRRHPATRVFQALRIVVNRELEELSLGLQVALSLLRIGGRLVVISFHSLEESTVMDFARAQGDRLQVRRALRPQAAEKRRNPQARSALLRTLIKIGTGPAAGR